MLRVKSLAGSERLYVPVFVRGAGEDIHWQVLDPNHELDDWMPAGFRRGYGWAGDGLESLTLVAMAIRDATNAGEGGDS